jgi:phosphoribosyl 1,2-cyclic phosphodiesterase/CheY-like chemotaxis protein
MKTVLMIDDDAEYREVMGELLRQNGWQVLESADGDSGFEIAKQQKPEVILCDLLMPRCNGFHVCRSLRNEGLLETKIIITSARDFASDRQDAFDAGANEYLSKPIELSRLLPMLAQIREHAETSESARATVTTPSEVWLKFWGVRGSIPTPGPTTVYYGGNTTCVEVRAGEQIIILDAGTGLRLLGEQLIAEFDHHPLNLTLLLTHTHWDHIQGLPFFSPAYRPQNHLRILGYEGARHGLQNVLSNQMESTFFPVGLSQLPANLRIEELKDMDFAVGSVQVKSCFANHPGMCVGYRIFTSRGSVAFFPDNEPFLGRHRLGGPERSDTELDFARNQDQRMADFLSGTDVLIMDTQYDCQEYKEHVGWGHGCLEDVLRLAIQAEVRRLYMFHHDPSHNDAKISQMAERARQFVAEQKAQLEVQAAREGTLVKL